jgi:hypothetical protein
MSTRDRPPRHLTSDRDWTRHDDGARTVQEIGGAVALAPAAAHVEELRSPQRQGREQL